MEPGATLRVFCCREKSLSGTTKGLSDRYGLGQGHYSSFLRSVNEANLLIRVELTPREPVCCG